jgi:hypothetical protein
VPVDMDGNPLSAEEWAILQEELAQKEARRREVHERAAAERAAADEARRQQRADPGGVPWTKTEMEAGLSGAPRSNIPMDAELTVTNSGPKPVDISSVAPDHGLTKVDSGDIERDPKTGKAKRGGAWAVAAPRPIKDFIVDENDEQGIQQFEEFADAQQDPNARRRKDLERAGYQAVRKQRPDGSEVWVYSTRDQDSPVDSERRDMARRGVSLDGTPGRQMSEGMSGGTEFQRRQRIQRMADKLGVTPAEVRKMMTEGGELGRGETPNASQIGYNSFAAFDPVRERLATQRGAEKKAKAEEAQAAVVRNAQWRQNLQEWFKNPTVTDEQRQFASAILLRRGATPNDIDAAQAEGVQRGIALGARQNINVTDQDMAREAWRQKQREADPAAAGASDIASGRPDSPQGIVEVERLADEIDDTTFGFSYENERALAIRLQQPPYNMKKPEAEAAANRAANKRRWYSTSQADAQNNAGGQPTPPPAAGGRQPGGEPIIPGAWFPL